MITLRSPNGTATCTIDPRAGGRLESLVIECSDGHPNSGREMLVTRHEPAADVADPFSWGCFVMAPYCGRVRHGRFLFDGSAHQLPRRHGPHAMHGTVMDRPWIVLDSTPTRVLLTCDLGPDWPFIGAVRHEMEIDDRSLKMTLGILAEEPMPAQVGWHPWFRRTDDYTLPFGALLQRDAEGIATSEPVAFSDRDRGRFDDCFADADGPITIRVDDVALTLDSDCSHWTVFDQLPHGICFEPQSGPPNGINGHPERLDVDGRLTRWFSIGWDTGPHQ